MFKEIRPENPAPSSSRLLVFGIALSWTGSVPHPERLYEPSLAGFANVNLRRSYLG